MTAGKAVKSLFKSAVAPWKLAAGVAVDAGEVGRQWWDYQVDAAQRAWLTLDILRRRGDQQRAHEEAGQPPVLDYAYEVLMDGAKLERPVNYSLLRLLPLPSVFQDDARRPYVIIDPRAGHGPGIGGFKSDSQVGVALRAGHPVYFVSFSPRPQPSQTLADVARAEALFLEEVARRHPEAPKPTVIGNCQAGWAVAMLAAVEPELTGPIVLNGAPMSYWAGKEGKNPMRYLGGLAGGTWVASLLADLGGGVFDGAWLVMNFENLNPGHSLIGKPYHVFDKADSEGERFLKFERWWNAFFLMNAEEMDFIVDNLFIGNKLGAGQVQLDPERRVSLRDIKAPIVVFASQGDNITPPQQALNWIADVYPDDEAILRDQQVIVYALHEDIGHLGIFVSGRVARREHAAIMGTMECIDALPPGLYEMLIEHGPGESEDSGWRVRFVERSLQDILDLDDTRQEEQDFAALAEVSELTSGLYRSFARPVVRAVMPRPVAAALRQAMPMRVQHQIFSSRNPAMWPVPPMAWLARRTRRPVGDRNPFRQAERKAARTAQENLDQYRDLRDAAAREAFRALYGPSGLGMWLGKAKPAPGEPWPTLLQQTQPELVRQGGFVEGLLRALALLSRADQDVEPEAFLRLAELVQQEPRLGELGQQEVLRRLHQQHLWLKFHPEAALEALPALLPATEDRALVLAQVQRVVLGQDSPNEQESQALERLRAALA